MTDQQLTDQLSRPPAVDTIPADHQLTPPDAATPARRPWHQVAPLPFSADVKDAIRHFAAHAYAELLAIADPDAPKWHSRAFESAYTAAMALCANMEWRDINWGLSDGERAAEDLRGLLRFLGVDPDTIEPAGDAT